MQQNPPKHLQFQVQWSQVWWSRWSNVFLSRPQRPHPCHGDHPKLPHCSQGGHPSPLHSSPKDHPRDSSVLIHDPRVTPYSNFTSSTIEVSFSASASLSAGPAESPSSAGTPLALCSICSALAPCPVCRRPHGFQFLFHLMVLVATPVMDTEAHGLSSWTWRPPHAATSPKLSHLTVLAPCFTGNSLVPWSALQRLSVVLAHKWLSAPPCPHPYSVCSIYTACFFYSALVSLVCRRTHGL